MKICHILIAIFFIVINKSPKINFEETVIGFLRNLLEDRKMYLTLLLAIHILQ